MPEHPSVITRTSKEWFITLGQLIHVATIHLLIVGIASASEPPSAAPMRVSFSDLGSPSLELRGSQPTGTVHVGVRGDEVIEAAKLRLRMTYSPALLPQLSHLRVSLNDQVLAALPLPVEQAGREIEREVAIDPRYFTDYNQLRFDLVGHYSLECEDPNHSSLWATLSSLSELELTVNRLELRNDLALLPAPFFDRRDNRRLTLPIVLPEQPSREIVRAAGVAASWFGAMADYRSARFPVSFAAVPERHALVFATNAARPAQLQLGDVTSPTVSIIDHPSIATIKLLVFQGKDEDQLRQAVEGVVLGTAVLSGAQATITAIERPKRQPYDAPRWLRTHRPVKLGELVENPRQLQASGVAPQPIRINLRLPPDLFVWNQPGVPMDLRYRFTPPNEYDASTLNISINELLLRSYRLRPDSGVEQATRAENVDMLVLGGQGAAPLLSEWKKDLALAINGDERKLEELAVAERFNPVGEDLGGYPTGGRVQLNANGSLGAFISFESPLGNDRTVVALASSDNAAAQALLATLEDDGKVALILGDLAIVRGDTVQSYRGESVYYVGSLSLWKRLWFHLSQHVLLFTLVALSMVVVTAMLLYGGLQRRVARRLAVNSSQ